MDPSSSSSPSPNLTVKVRHLEQDTIMALHQMVQKAGWPLTPRDCLFLQTSPDVEAFGIYASPTNEGEMSVKKIGKVAQGDELLVGTTVVTFYGTFTGIGLVIVSEAFRRRGLATQLMKHALAISQQPSEQRQDKPKRAALIATEMGEPLYRKLGFYPTGQSAYLRQTVSSIENHPTYSSLLSSNEKTQLFSFFMTDLIKNEKKLFNNLPNGADGMDVWTQALKMSDEAIGGTRSRITTGYVAEGGMHVLLGYDARHAKGFQVRGWCAVRPSSNKDRFVGPVVAYTAVEALHLLRTAIPTQLTMEKEHNRHLVPATQPRNEQAFLISFDSRGRDSRQFIDGIQKDGFTVLFPMTIFEYDLERGAEAAFQARQGGKGETDGPQQYAIMDPALL